MKRWTAWFCLGCCISLLALGCGGGGGRGPTVTVIIAPTSVTVVVGGTQQFQAAVSGVPSGGDTGVKWLVDDVEGGNATKGTITANGLYTAPATLPSPNTVTVKAKANAAPNPTASATVTLDSGVRVSVTPATATVGTGETFPFRADVTGTTVQDVKWFVNDVEGGNATTGTINTAGQYKAPDNVPSPATVTIKATSVKDSTRSATALVTVVTAADPTLTEMNPTSAAQGSLFQDVYLTGTNFISTTKVLFNGNELDASRITAVSSKLLRVRLPDSILAAATPGGVPVQVRRPTQPLSAAKNFSVVSVRPALVGASPDSGTQGAAAVTFNVNGGFFGAAGQQAVVRAEFNGGVRAATINSARQLGVIIGATGSGDLDAPGLISFAVRNTAAPQQFAVANFAVQPSAGSATVVGSPLPVGTKPGAVAVNTATGIAVVANRGSNDLTLIALTSPAPPICSPPPAGFPGICVASIPVGMSPTGVAVDHVRNLAVVANNGGNSVSIVDLAMRGVTTVTKDINAKPFSVGVNPLTGLVLVAYQPVAPSVGTNVASIIDLNLTPPAVVGAVTIGAGTNPQVAVEPRLNWAIVTPGGGVGSLSVVDLGRRSLAIAAAPAGAVRAANVVTITTATPHNLAVNGAVLVTGVADSSFNGAFTVASVPSPTTFAYAQTGANAASGGGLAADPGLQTLSGITANGASRTANVVTITTTAPHGLITGQAVLITGVADASFNGYFTVASVPNSTTFTYAQTAANATSGGGSALYARVLASVTVGPGVTGVGINPETEKAVLADPTTNTLVFLSVLDQTAKSLTLQDGCSSSLACAFATAINPLTDTAVSVNFALGEATVIDPRTPKALGPRIGVGTNPKAVAIDPGSNLAVIANEGSDNVSILSLGGLRPLHITQLVLPSARQFSASAPTATLRSDTDLPVTILGKGFVNTSSVRLDGTPLPTANALFRSDRRLDVTIPAATFLGAARRYAVDVVNPGGPPSNVADLTVIRAIDVRGTGCTAPAPRAVAIDPERNQAVVTNPGCNNVSLINLNDGTIANTVAVGKNPQGVATISRLSKVVVTNRGDNTASVIDLTKTPPAVSSPVNVGTEPLGVAINQDTAKAVVANSASNSVSLFSTEDANPTATAVAVDQRPVAVAIDSVRNLAMVAASTANNLDQIDLSQATPTVAFRYPCATDPTGVVFDAAGGLFVASCSLDNSLTIADPATQSATSLFVGINPTSLAYNFQSSTLVTLNTASNTMSVVDFLGRRVRAVLGMSASQQFAVDIHPLSNLAVIADENNNRVLLVPLPR